MKKIFKLIKNN